MLLYSEIIGKPIEKLAIDVDGVSYTYGAFYQRIEQYVSYFQRLNLGGNRRVILYRLGAFDLLASIYACSKLNISASPLLEDNPQLLEQRLALLGTEHVVYPNTELNLQKQLPFDACSREKQEILVIFTSGTTSGVAKGVRLSESGIQVVCREMNRQMNLNDSINELVYASLDHAFAFGRCHSVLSISGTLSLTNKKFNLLTLSACLMAKDCNALSVAPSLLASLISVDPHGFAELNQKFKWLQIGAMRFDQVYRQKLLSLWPDVGCFLHYGLSEAMRSTFIELNHDKDKLHTEGRAIRGCQISILDEQNQALPIGSVGRIAISGTHVCLGYLDAEDWEKNTYHGLYLTSDQGYLDQDGYLVFCGRDANLINKNGVLLSAEAIESHLTKLLYGLSFCIVAVARQKGVKDDEISLVIVGEAKLSLTDINRYLTQKSLGISIDELRYVEQIPMTRTKKINRKALVALLKEETIDG